MCSTMGGWWRWRRKCWVKDSCFWTWQLWLLHYSERGDIGRGCFLYFKQQLSWIGVCLFKSIIFSEGNDRVSITLRTQFHSDSYFLLTLWRNSCALSRMLGLDNPLTSLMSWTKMFKLNKDICTCLLLYSNTEFLNSGYGELWGHLSTEHWVQVIEILLTFKM